MVVDGLKVQISWGTEAGFALEARVGEPIVIKNGFVELFPAS
jgi:hypothetical protein